MHQYFTPSCGWIIFHPIYRPHFFFHSSLDIWLVPTFGLLWIAHSHELSHTSFLCVCEHIFSVLLGVFIGMEWLDPVATLCLTYRGTATGKESTYQCRRLERHGFNPWVRNIPWSRKWQPAPVVLPWTFHGQRSLVGSLQRVRHDWATEHTHISLIN